MDLPETFFGAPRPDRHSNFVRDANRHFRPRRGRGGVPPAPQPERDVPPACRQPPADSLTNQDVSRIPGGNRGRSSRRGFGVPGGRRSRVVGQDARVFGSQLTVASGPSTGPQADAVESPSGQAIADQRSAPDYPRYITEADEKTKISVPSRRPPKSSAPDFATRIHDDISNGVYDCPICFNEILRASRVWSCKTCYTVFHLQCIKKWSSREGQQWRCPGCNLPQDNTPSAWLCWCWKEVDPKPVPGLPPHSCHQTCGKLRTSKNCPHPCQLLCHAGPCPPCEYMGPTRTCFCGKESVTRRCVDTNFKDGWSCGKLCGDIMPCGEHICEKCCHEGHCGSCRVLIKSRCYCGKDMKSVRCSERGEQRESCLPQAAVKNGSPLTPESTPSSDPPITENWTGSFQCENVCNRTFDCGVHSCQKDCHDHAIPVPHCPMSPDVVSHCRCGKTLLSALDCDRKSCRDPIPSCGQVCGRAFPCGHFCGRECHSRECVPCLEKIKVKCRCGRTTSPIVCHQGSDEQPQCSRICKTLLNCGRHECAEKCCPGTAAAAQRTKRKLKSFRPEDFESEHLCFRTCGKQLSCKNPQHTCQEACHRGPCSTCREAIFEEIYCYCGKTVLFPPQPCGTLPPTCKHPCTRAKSCAHPRVGHFCHLDDACPRCPYLVSKQCQCGKAVLKNVPCWSTPSCSNTCQKRLKCGIHYCQKPCHRPGECEDPESRPCTQQCGKMRTSPGCGHPCLEPCHAPYPCKEDKPCQAKIIITCNCQNLRKEVRCLATKSTENKHREAFACNSECLRLQRNRKLAEALNISPDHLDSHIPYSSKTLEMYKDNPNWSLVQEREIRLFAADDKEKRLRFKPMPPHQRGFLHSLAEDFGLDSESMDPEPYRHVALFKTPRFVSSPMKTLAQCVQIKTTQSSTAPATIIEDRIEHFNALIITSPRFALTTEELYAKLRNDLSTLPNTAFNISFLPSEEVVLYPAPSPEQIKEKDFESTLYCLKGLISKTISTHKLGAGVVLCRIDHSLNVLRREYKTEASNGWSQVVRRSAPGIEHKGPPTVGDKNVFRVLGAEVSSTHGQVPKEKREKEKQARQESVVESWETAAEEWGD